jgi:hypothetical protein
MKAQPLELYRVPASLATDIGEVKLTVGFRAGRWLSMQEHHIRVPDGGAESI